jgi:hypothetical protein
MEVARRAERGRPEGIARPARFIRIGIVVRHYAVFPAIIWLRGIYAMFSSLTI